MATAEPTEPVPHRRPRLSCYTCHFFQDNQSTIKLMGNGRPTSELSKHIRLGYFWVYDLIVKKIIKLVYCPTEFMIADIMTKPLQGSLFRIMRVRIMGAVPCPMVEGYSHPRSIKRWSKFPTQIQVTDLRPVPGPNSIILHFHRIN
jgi:hypothetical protein